MGDAIIFVSFTRRSPFWRARFSALLFALTFVLASCGGSSSNNTGGGNPPPVPTATLTATPATITAGSTSNITLAFTSTNATSGTITGQGAVGVNGQIVIQPPSANTTYVFTATGSGGSTTASATVTVNPPPAVTVNLTASATNILAPTSITLSWTSSNASSVVITSNAGFSQGVPASGSYTVSPLSATTTFTATANGVPGQQAVTSSVTINVTPITSFSGMGPGSASPAQDVDPVGAAGTTQFLQYVNTYFQAYDKVTQQPLLPVGGPIAPQPIGTAWSGGANGNCEGTSIQLDAVVTFDRFAAPNGRWVIAAKSTRGTGATTDDWFCIAVSSTDDLTTSTWYSYSFKLTSILGQDKAGNDFYPDWPKIGTWPDGADSQEGAYYVSLDMEDEISQDELGVAVCALDRTNLLQGLPMRTEQCFISTSDPAIELAHSLIPADVDGTTPPPLGRDEFLVSIQNPTGSATQSSSINLWDCKLDPTWPFTPAALPCTQTSVSVPVYTPGCYQPPPNQTLTICVPEPPYQVTQPEEIDSVGDRLMPRFAYRNFLTSSGGYESFLVSHTILTGAGAGTGANGQQTGIRWYELRDNGTTAPAFKQSGTINPDAVLFRFLPSIAQDKNANAAVGYSFSNGANMPGIAVSYWNLNTPGATPTETVILQGLGEEISPGTGGVGVGIGKWGSYSNMSVDPVDDCTFWYVNEYWPVIAAAPWETNISSFNIYNSNCTP